MYLSSHRLGDHPEQLLTLLRTPGPVAVIANALDAAPAEIRARGVHDELAALRDLGLTAEELDLRDYFPDHQRLADTLAGYQLVWLRGGNAFVLRYALARSGADQLLAELVRRDALVWAGYSAGCCVLAPSLGGLELMVDPGVVRDHYRAEPSGRAWACWPTRSCRTTGPGIPRARPPSWSLPATAPTACPTERCETAKPSSSMLEAAPHRRPSGGEASATQEAAS